MMQRYFWLAYLLLVTLAAALGADMAVSYLTTQLRSSTVSEEGASAGPAQAAVRRPAGDYDVIAQRHIFNSKPIEPGDPCKGPNPPPHCEGPEPPPPPPPPELKLKLVGVVTGGGSDYAVIEDTAARGEQQFYQVGDPIKGRSIVEIRKDCVILARGNKEEKLCFPDRQGETPTSPAPRRISRGASDADDDDNASEEDVVRVDDATWRIRRELMQEQFANLGGLAQQARVMPYVVQGETRGFRVTRLKPNSLLHKIGLQHGDVLQKVNGSSITSPTEALQAYQQLQNVGTVRLEILRRDRPSTLTYEIR